MSSGHSHERRRRSHEGRKRSQRRCPKSRGTPDQVRSAPRRCAYELAEQAAAGLGACQNRLIIGERFDREQHDSLSSLIAVTMLTIPTFVKGSRVRASVSPQDLSERSAGDHVGIEPILEHF